jgi:hypothetical protein
MGLLHESQFLPWLQSRNFSVATMVTPSSGGREVLGKTCKMYLSACPMSLGQHIDRSCKRSPVEQPYSLADAGFLGSQELTEIFGVAPL